MSVWRSLLELGVFFIYIYFLMCPPQVFSKCEKLPSSQWGGVPQIGVKVDPQKGSCGKQMLFEHFKVSGVLCLLSSQSLFPISRS